VVTYYPGLLDYVRNELEKDKKGSTANTRKALATFGFLCESILRRKNCDVHALVSFYTGGKAVYGTYSYNKAYEEISGVLELQKKIGHTDFNKRKEEEKIFLLCEDYDARRKYLSTLPEAPPEKQIEETKTLEEAVKEEKVGFFKKISNIFESYKKRRAEKKEEHERTLYKRTGFGCAVRPLAYGATALFAGVMFYLSNQADVKLKKAGGANTVATTKVATLAKNKFEVYKTPEEKRAAFAFRNKTLEQKSEEMVKPLRKTAEAVKVVSYEILDVFGSSGRTARINSNLEFASENSLEKARQEVQRLDKLYDAAINDIYTGVKGAAEKAKEISRHKREAEFKLMGLEKMLV